MAKIQIIKIPDQDFTKLKSKLATDQSSNLEFETLPYRTKKRSRKKDGREQQHSFSLGDNFKLRANAFIDELTQKLFSQEAGFLISPKVGKSKQVSVYQWLDKLISLQAIDDDFRDFLSLAEESGFDDSSD